MFLLLLLLLLFLIYIRLDEKNLLQRRISIVCTMIVIVVDMNCTQCKLTEQFLLVVI